MLMLLIVVMDDGYYSHCDVMDGVPQSFRLLFIIVMDDGNYSDFDVILYDHCTKHCRIKLKAMLFIFISHKIIKVSENINVII